MHTTRTWIHVPQAGSDPDASAVEASQVTAVPESSTLELTALGLPSLGCAGWYRRRRA